MVLRLKPLICKMGIIIPNWQGYCEDYNKRCKSAEDLIIWEVLNKYSLLFCPWLS
jgi:hypothetical protein